MERLVVTRTKEGLWSVSHEGETLGTYQSEEEALSVTFKRAAERRQMGIRVVVVITQAQNEFKAP